MIDFLTAIYETRGEEIAGVVQWQNESFPSFRRGFDSLRPLCRYKSGPQPISSNIVAIIYVLGLLVPLLGLLLLLSVSGKATKELRSAGIKVGLLGANPNAI